MTSESTFKIICGNCNAKLTVKARLAGKTAMCPQCAGTIHIPADLAVEQGTKPPIPPATSRQKEYAASLEIEFPADINRRDISALIERAVTQHDDERYERLEELDKKEGALWEQAKAEVLSDFSPDELPISKASPKQIVEALDERGLATLLITVPWDDIDDFRDLTGARADVYFADSITVEDFQSVILMISANIINQRGK